VRKREREYLFEGLPAAPGQAICVCVSEREREREREIERERESHLLERSPAAPGTALRGEEHAPQLTRQLPIRI
jgi:hypothetical protein